MRCEDITFSGYKAVYHKARPDTDKAVIAMLGGRPDDFLARRGAAYLISHGCNVLSMSTESLDYSHVDVPLESFREASLWLRAKGNRKLALTGASTTAMVALEAASFFPEFSLVVALSPSDFVMQGFTREGGTEKPVEGKSTMSLEGKSLPYLPFAYSHPRYSEVMREDAKANGNLAASRRLFEDSERIHPLTDEIRIKVEDIKGKVILCGAEDDAMWDTVRYIERMRLRNRSVECWTYRHGTHFVYPEGILPHLVGPFTALIFKAGRTYYKECRETRLDIDRRLSSLLEGW